MNISIARDFSPYPHGRTSKDGEFSGERFRTEVLEPMLRRALDQHGVIQIDLDGVKALGSSFAEEAFGGLIRLAIAPSEDVREAIKVRYTKPWLRPVAENIENYMRDAAER
ncbi:STAS-like domain-containing protein [Paracoccus sp. YLB-12]|uniref:STAS-like domain-containing protein n=1 Tax=Paracoccus maritimus TaxID=2933292 RepID=A0ABT2KB23_9RHOB|nr:STAS-like domain-containing protein [Paracoccus sp. YLB-12]MCT4333720.1 STAS-like domain-containing protein [Paracoccus sp. YLB-12]